MNDQDLIALAYMEEYRDLRSEIHQRVNNQLLVIGGNIALTAALVPVLFPFITRSNAPIILGVAIIFGIVAVLRTRYLPNPSRHLPAPRAATPPRRLSGRDHRATGRHHHGLGAISRRGPVRLPIPAHAAAVHGCLPRWRDGWAWAHVHGDRHRHRDNQARLAVELVVAGYRADVAGCAGDAVRRVHGRVRPAAVPRHQLRRRH